MRSAHTQRAVGARQHAAGPQQVVAEVELDSDAFRPQHLPRLVPCDLLHMRHLAVSSDERHASRLFLTPA